VIPTELGAIKELKHLSLKDNRIGGFIPSEIGSLNVLETLELNHNELKGEVPRELAQLENLHRALLHANELGGSIVFTDTSSKRVLISDCGFPSTLPAPIECEQCTMCCNGEGNCQENIKGLFWSTLWLVCKVAFVLFVCIVPYWNLVMQYKQPCLTIDTFATFGDGSVYFLMLTDNPVSWIMGLCTIVFQFLLALLFGMKANDLTTNGSDWIYTWMCSPTIDECSNNDDTNIWGWAMFAVLMFYSLLSAYGKCLKLICAGWHVGSKRLWFVGVAVLGLITVTVASSYTHLRATNDTSTGILKDTIVLLVITQLDEWLFAGLRVVASSFLTKQTLEAETRLELMEHM